MTNPIVVERYVWLGGTRVRRHCYWCSGCNSLHCIAIRPYTQRNGAGWEFSGTLERPTYNPSQLTTWSTPKGEFRCHTFIRDGVVEFLSDCTHSLAGTKVPLPPVPDWVVKESLDD